MGNGKWCVLLSAALAAVHLGAVGAGRLEAQEAPTHLPHAVQAPPAAMRLTLEEAKQRALDSSKLLQLANLNAESKAFAVKAIRADYFPKITGTALYLHFNDDLGTVLSGGGRSVSGPKGVPLVTFPAFAVNVPVVNQDSSLAMFTAVQPITDLLKVRQGVKIAQADEGIARAELEAGARKLASGVEQLFWGLLAARRIQAGAAAGVQGAELVAKTGALDARAALVEARQALQQVDKQVADLQEQLNGLLGLPLCTALELVEPALPALPYQCADDVVGLALASSPEIHSAQETIHKAEAALAAGKLEYVPSLAAVGGYTNQTAASYVQQDIGFIGAVGTYTIVDWGKRRNVIRERQDLVAMATLKLQQTEDDVRQKAVKAFRDVGEAQAALKTAQEMVEVRKEIEKKATTPEALRDPTALAALLKASKDRMLAEVEAVKADLAYREAYVQLMALIGKQ
jgi:outer membrane protein TolC